jgi:glycosyltransferase involved in cell wall biosynthesis
MASGLVVIAYDYAAAKMHIRHDQTGVLVPYGDSKAFIDSAAGLARDPLSLSKIRRQAREYVTSIEWRYVVERFEVLLTSARNQNDESPHFFDNMPRLGQIAAGGRV